MVSLAQGRVLLPHEGHRCFAGAERASRGGRGLRPWFELREIATGCGSVLPRPGSGGTATRFRALADWGARDLSLARLAEGHVDALAILAEAERDPVPGATYGVWAARPAGGTTARRESDGWHLEGEKPFCSGSTWLDRALVTAEGPDGYRLFDVSVASTVVGIRPGSWPAVGMADSLSETLEFGGPAARGRCRGRSAQFLPGPTRVLVRGDRRGRLLVRGSPRSGRPPAERLLARTLQNWWRPSSGGPLPTSI